MGIPTSTMRTFTAILSCAAIAAVNADGHISTRGPFNVQVDTTADAGSPMSWNPVGGDFAVKHEPVIVLSGDGGASVKVRGGDPDDLTNLHPQTYPDHHITSVWIEDQNGVVVCSHEFVDEATPSAECDADVVTVALAADPDATFTAYEHCNLHGTWQGPTTYLAMSRDAISTQQNADMNVEVFPKTEGAAPVKHEPAFVSEGDGGFSIKVLGTDGAGLHPQDAPTHFIEATWAVDGHGSVVAFSSVDEESTAQSSVFQFPDGFSGTVTPWEHCNLHGVWEGASFVVEASTVNEESENTGEASGNGEPVNTDNTAGATAITAVVVAVFGVMAAAMF